MKKVIRIVCSGMLLLPLLSLADEAPVVDISSSGIEVNNNAANQVTPAVTNPTVVPVTSSTISPDSSAMNASVNVPSASAGPASLDQLSQQVAYLQQQNLPGQIQQLQQQVSELRGQIETQGHLVEQLQAQLRSQYTDLNSRMTSTQNASNNNGADKTIAGVGMSTGQVDSVSPIDPAKKTAKLNNAKKTKSKVVETASVLTGNNAVSASASVSSPDAQTAMPAVNLPNTTPPPVAAPSVSTPNADVSPQETQAYEVAFGQIKEKKYSEAIQSFSDYLAKYPAGAYVPNAHYWLGELYAISGAADKAVSELTLVATNFSTSDKAPNAMLKLGNMAYDQENAAQAKEWWLKVQKQYPDSGAARVAMARMQQLEKTGE